MKRNKTYRKGGTKVIDYNNKNLRAKTFYAKFTRNRNGSFELARVNVLDVKNQYAQSIRRADKRDFTRALRNNEIVVS
jgi:hypothetical protein